MNFYGRRFNLYLLLAGALVLAAGCAISKAKKEDKLVAALRVHIESDANMASVTQTISVLRTEPVLVNIVTQPILTEADILAAKLVETPGGFAVQVTFSQSGSWTLEQYTASNPGKHFAIFGQWGDKLVNGRWLAAPSISRRVASGVLTFTPDATREEMELLVKGLNIAAKNYADKKMKE